MDGDCRTRDGRRSVPLVSLGRRRQGMDNGKPLAEMSAAEVRRAMWVVPVAMGTSALVGLAYLAVAVIEERIAWWLALVFAAVLVVWPAVVTIRARRNYRERLSELRDPITGSLPVADPPSPLAVSTRLWLLGTPVLVVVVVVLAASLPGAGNTCAAKGITTAAAREGICQRGTNLFGGGTTYNVVDAGHVLHMPGIDAQLLATSARVTPVTDAAISPDFYPNGAGMLVCLEIAITNRGASALTYDSGGTYVALLLQSRPPNTSAYELHDEIGVRGEPRPALASDGPIQPGQTETGWVAFVAPIWAMQTLSVASTHLDFALPNSQGVQTATYLGQIRLWKAANRRGTQALTNRPAA